MDIAKATWRKATDVGRQYALFELVLNGAILFDIGFSDAGKLEIAFDGAINGLLIEWTVFEELVARGRSLAEADL